MYSSTRENCVVRVAPSANAARGMQTATHDAPARASARRAAGAASTVETTATEQVRARLSFDFDQNNTADTSALCGKCAPVVAGRENSWQDTRAADQQALAALEAEWAQKLQAPLDELSDFEETVSRSATELHMFLSRC